jgi:hypothetical protein
MTKEREEILRVGVDDQNFFVIDSLASLPTLEDRMWPSTQLVHGLALILSGLSLFELPTT